MKYRVKMSKGIQSDLTIKTSLVTYKMSEAASTELNLRSSV